MYGFSGIRFTFAAETKAFLVYCEVEKAEEALHHKDVQITGGTKHQAMKG